MNLEEGLLAWLEETTGLDAYWLERKEGVKRCVVYRCISPANLQGNLANPRIKSDAYSLTVYHDDPEKGKEAAVKLRNQLDSFSGDLGGYPVQLIEFDGGFDQPLKQERGMPVYQFNRDFTISH